MFTDLATSVSRFLYRESLGLFLLRLVTGGIFLHHGIMKLGDMDKVVGMFSSMGLSAGVAWFIALLEVIGGAALIIGVATRLFGIIFAIQMFVAIFLTGGFAQGLGSQEFHLLLVAASLAVALIGSGRVSIFAMECENCGGMFCDGNVCVIEEEIPT
ncbi:MAG TPA: DoxX family protein [Candidatus Paceibacterota bacterium]|nr:DoxX family protein [Candidatus Paceibacterota bacterium]